MRKVCAIFLLITYINGYFGCSVKKNISEKNLDKSSKDDIMVVTKDSTRYFFKAKTYVVEDDSLAGWAKSDYNDRMQQVKIPLGDILWTEEIVEGVRWGRAAAIGITFVIVLTLLYFGHSTSFNLFSI